MELWSYVRLWRRKKFDHYWYSTNFCGCPIGSLEWHVGRIFHTWYIRLLKYDSFCIVGPQLLNWHSWASFLSGRCFVEMEEWGWETWHWERRSIISHHHASNKARGGGWLFDRTSIELLPNATELEVYATDIDEHDGIPNWAQLVCRLWNQSS